MATYLVTRHEGTRIWATAAAKYGRLPFAIDHVIEHLDPSALTKGDVVVGTLPLAMAAALEARGIAFWALDLDLPPDARGQEISGTALYHLYKGLGARFTRYQVRCKESATVAGKATKPRPAQPAIALIPVSEQLAPAAIGWLHQPTPQVCLLASPRMRPGAELLRAWLKDRDEPPEVSILGWDDSDYSSLLAQAEEWAGKLAAEDRSAVVVHLTGGTKPMSMALQRAFGKRGESFAGRLSGPYVDTAHQRIEDLLAQESSSTPMRSVLDIRDQLALQGFDTAEATSARPGYRAWLDRIALFDQLRGEGAAAWRSTWYALLMLAKSMMEKGLAKAEGKFAKATRIGGPRSRTFRLEAVDPKWGNWKGLRTALEGPFGRALASCGAATVTMDPRPARAFMLTLEETDLDEMAFLSGGWLEVWLARQFDKAGVDDWAQGLTITQKKKVKNELDLVVANGNRLLLVEVKTGKLDVEGREDSKGAEALYKLDSVAEKLGRYFSDRWLVSLTKLSPADRDRAESYKIRVFEGGNAKEIKQAIRDWVDNTRLDRARSFRPAFAGAESQAAKRGR